MQIGKQKKIIQLLLARRVLVFSPKSLVAFVKKKQFFFVMFKQVHKLNWKARKFQICPLEFEKG
jgi:hypothetical protein